MSASTWRASSGDPCFGTERRAFGWGVWATGFVATMPVVSACVNAPASGEQARRIVLGESGRPPVGLPSCTRRRCQVSTPSGVTSRTLLSSTRHRTQVPAKIRQSWRVFGDSRSSASRPSR